MNPGRFSTLAEQVAQVLRDGLREGRWQGRIPGRMPLAAELGVNHKTVSSAFRILEAEGIVVSRGAGKPRLLSGSLDSQPKPLRVSILLYEPEDQWRHLFVDLRHQLTEAGHVATFATKSLCELGMDASRVARFVERTEADAWIVTAGSRNILLWFSQGPKPAFALFGRCGRIPMASAVPKKTLAFEVLIDRLVKLGHRRIVMLAREERRIPEPGQLERHFLDLLAARGIPTSAYNLPNWGDRPGELQESIASLFRHTPPTALIIGDSVLFFAVMQHLAQLGFTAPQNLSLACTDSDPNFEWCIPGIAHISWDPRPVIRRVVTWAGKVSQGIEDREKSGPKARFIDGGTIGQAPGAKRSMP
ncbi:MAG: substrate-binding domain-containing protein [Akkermansiaceae bacterium]|jgi:hypothetical protein|nr:substrate-binding domain-containing protein [Akkermansiaceae bacterium]